MQQSRLLVVTGFIIWMSCSLPALVWNGPNTLSGGSLTMWSTAFACFGLTLALGVFSGTFTGKNNGVGLFLLMVLTLCSFVMINVASGMARYVSAMPLTVIASRLPYMTSKRASWLATLGIVIGLVAIYSWYDGWIAALSGGGLYTVTLTLALSRSCHDISESAVRAQLLAANAELMATRELLAESSRTEERLRISRDLHDTLGHHLTALSIQLDVASRQSAGQASDSIREAHAITRLLLSDVRDVVSQLRNEECGELAVKFRELATNIGELNIHLQIPEVLSIEEPARADVLLRCVQEIITNTRRHANARNLWIQIAVNEATIELQSRDDGQGTDQITLGHGLKGMRERFAQYNGRVEVNSSPTIGFAVHAYLPRYEVVS